MPLGWAPPVVVSDYYGCIVFVLFGVIRIYGFGMFSSDLGSADSYALYRITIS